MYFDKLATIVSAKGGTLSFVDQFGEFCEIPIAAGSVKMIDFAGIIPHGAEIELSKGLIYRAPPPAVSVLVPPEFLETSANPEWQPSSSFRQEQEMRSIIDNVRQQVIQDLTQKRRNSLSAADTDLVADDKPKEPQEPKEPAKHDHESAVS